MIDFERAFDTEEWSFIENTLQFYGFGQSLQKWIKTFYCDISSAVTSNGHVSKFVSLGRGFRQETLCPPCPPSHLGTWLCEGGGHASEAAVSGKLV